MEPGRKPRQCSLVSPTMAGSSSDLRYPWLLLKYRTPYSVPDTSCRQRWVCKTFIFEFIRVKSDQW